MVVKAYFRCFSLFMILMSLNRCPCTQIVDPSSPPRVFASQSYTNSFEDDSAPESGTIIPAEYSPTGCALLISAYEDSNTLAVFQITT